MIEDDDGKTVFQPSKRKTVQKEDAPKGEALTPEQNNDALEENTLEEKKVVEEKPSEDKTSSAEKAKPKNTMQFRVGDVLNNVYQIKRFIAKGGMGEVYEAVNVHNTDERVAIKVMLPEFAADERVKAMFAKEAGTLTRLHHEAIVPYRLSSRDEQGRPFIVTAYVDGPSLEDQFKEFSPTEEELGDLTRCLAEGLGKAHSFGAIHRDIAPDNVLLVDGNPGLPKIIDFGIAQDARAENKGATIIGDGFAGKLNYVAPEQLGEYGRNIGPWTDIYSLALTMLAVATQKHADMGGSIASSVKKRMTVPDISAIPPRFRRAFKAALQPDPTDRPQSMLAFIKLLDQPAETEKLSSFAPLNSDAKPVAAPEVIKPAKQIDFSGKGKLIGAGVGAVVLIGAVSAFMMMRGGTPDKAPITDVAIIDPPTTDVEPPQQVRLTAAMIESAIVDSRCSWLEISGKDKLANFDPAKVPIEILGGAGNVVSTRNSIARSLTRAIGQNVNIDVSEVALFDPRLCDIVGAFKNIRNPERLIASDETSRIYEAKTRSVSDDEGNISNRVNARITVDVSNINPNNFITILSIDPRGFLFPIANGREQINFLINRFDGNMKQDGFTLSFLTDDPKNAEKETYGFVVISGDNEFPQQFFTDTDSQGAYPVSQGWVSQFNSLARSNNWTSDIYWFSVVDELDD